MPKSKYFKPSNLIFILIIAVLLIPQTRRPIQILLNKGIALINTPSAVPTTEREQLRNYDWTLQDFSGNTLEFNNVQGKVVIVNFWATWCPPCIAEMPSFEALYHNYKDREDIVFLFVSNETSEDLYEFMVQHDYSFNVYRPMTEYPSEFDVSSIPRTFVIDKSGGIVIDKSGAVNWNSTSVKTLLDDLLKTF